MTSSFITSKDDKIDVLLKHPVFPSPYYLHCYTALAKRVMQIIKNWSETELLNFKGIK